MSWYLVGVDLRMYERSSSPFWARLRRAVGVGEKREMNSISEPRKANLRNAFWKPGM